MSKVIALVGAQVATNVQVKQRTAKLNILFVTPVANAATWALLKAQMNAVIVNVELQNPSGATENIVPKVPLGTLAEIYAAIEGFIDVRTVGVTGEVRFSVELSYDGALLFDNDTNIVIGITGMVALDTLDVFATDFPTASQRAIKTNVIRFSANAPQGVSLQAGSHLHLPVASFEKIELYYPNSQSITLLKEELAEWCLEGNQLQGSLMGVVTNGFIDFFSLNTVDATACKITMTADVNAFLFTQVQVG